MERLFEYRDDMIYCHHTIDAQPIPADYPVHTHEMLEIYYIISGSGTYLVEGTPYTLHPGDVMIMREAETHKLMIDASQPYERIAIHFSPKLIRLITTDKLLLRPFLERPLGQLNLYRAKDFLNSHWETAFQHFDFSDSSQIRAHIIARMMTILSELSDAYDRRSGETPPRKDSASQLVAYVNEHLFSDISMQNVCASFFCSPAQINRLFRQATGTSLKRYINVKRLLAARAMLQRGEPAGAVCSACGFDDYSVFFRAYKKQFSQSPRGDMPRRRMT